MTDYVDIDERRRYKRDEEDGKYKLDEVILLEEHEVDPPDPPPNGGESEPDEWTDFTPLWRVGASGGLYADPGEGYVQGWYKKSPAKLITSDGSKVDVHEVEIFIELEAINPNIPDGEGFEFELPATITPANPRTGRGGGGDLWILGGANSFAIAPKWTDRNDRPMRLIVHLGDGREWTTSVPKEIPGSAESKSTCSVYFKMDYLV